MSAALFPLNQRIAAAASQDACAECLVGSIQSDCLNRFLFSGEASLHRALRESVARHHRGRDHQELGNESIAATGAAFHCFGEVKREERLGGLLSYSCRETA